MQAEEMKYELKPKSEKIDWGIILEGVMDKRLWGKTWTIFEYGDLVITMRLDTILVSKNQVSIIVRSDYREGSEEITGTFETFYLPLDEAHRNSTVFDKKLIRTIEYVVEMLAKLVLKEGKYGLNGVTWDVMYLDKKLRKNIVENIIKLDSDLPKEYLLKLVNSYVDSLNFDFFHVVNTHSHNVLVKEIVTLRGHLALEPDQKREKLIGKPFPREEILDSLSKFNLFDNAYKKVLEDLRSDVKKVRDKYPLGENGEDPFREIMRKDPVTQELLATFHETIQGFRDSDKEEDK